MKKEHFLWQLFNLENDFVNTTEELEVKKKRREGVNEESKTFKNEASKKKKEQAEHLKVVVQHEKKITEKGNRLDKTVSVFSTLGVCCGN